MPMTFSEACEAVADVFEMAPETFCQKAYALDDDDQRVNVMDDGAAQYCLVGGVVAAMGVLPVGGHQWFEIERVEELLKPHAVALGFEFPEDANNEGGRLVAIKLLRMAAAKGG